MKNKPNPDILLLQNVKKILLIMKISLLLILVSVLNTYASSIFSQNSTVSVSMQNVTVREVVREIEKQGGINFLYNDNLQELNRYVSVSFADQPIKDVLESALDQADMTYEEIKDNFVVLLAKPEKNNIQQITVSGRVTDAATGEPLPGASIVVQGTTSGTTTGGDGEYSLVVPSRDVVLVFSFIGYVPREVIVGDSNIFNISLEEDVRLLDEIVVVGYGTRRREELTGSVSTVSSENIEISAAPDIASRMQGHVTGVSITTRNSPGGGSIVRVRGMGTINNNDPLYVIDGVPTKSGMNQLNPNDIESISVLKDASSAAIYGSRGANGVIIITTKRGRVRTAPSVSFAMRTGINQLTNQYDLLNTQEYGELLWLEARNSGMTPGNAIYGFGEVPVIPDYIWPVGASEGDPSVDPALYRYWDYLIHPANKEGTRWMDEISRNGVVQEYNFSVAGGSETANYAVSAGYFDETGYLLYTGFDRYTLRNNVDVKITDWFKAGQTMGAVLSNSRGTTTDNSESSPISHTYRSQPIVPVYDIMGNFAGSRSGPLGNATNPVAMLTRDQNNYTKNLRLIGNVYGEATILKDFQLRSLFGYDYRTAENKGFTFPDPEGAEPRFIEALNDGRSNTLQWNWSNTLGFDQTFSDVHRIGVILGTEAVSSVSQYISGYRAGFFSTDPRYMVLDAGEIGHTNTGGGSDWRLFSVFGRLNYDFSNKYLLEATVRRDGSSRFGSQYRYSIFPAFSAAWTISSENFMEPTRGWLDFLKLRAGWGRSGNDEIGNYNAFSTYIAHEWRSTYDIAGTNTSSVVGFQPDALGNPNARWETTSTINLGIDATVLQNKLSLSLDLWQRNTSDMLYRIGIPYVSGVATAPFVNIGDMENKGIDFEIGYRNSSASGDFTYSVSANVSRYVNEIVKLSDNVEEEIIAGLLRNMYYSRATTGTAFPEFYGYIVDGIFQSQTEADAHPPAFGSYNQPGRFKYRDINGDGVINSDDMTYIGSPHPDFTGGLNFDLAYKNFDLNLFFYGSYGNDMINYVRRWIDYTQFSGNRSKDRLYRSWGSPYLADNQDAILPIADYDAGSQQPSTHFVEDGSFLRLKNLRLGYTLPQSSLNSLRLQTLRIYIQASNLYTFTNYSGLDPELYSSGTSMGLDQGAWPTSRQVMLGINISF